MAIEKFNREELKYLLTINQYNSLLKMINDHIQKDKYHKEKICNLYFDTINNDLIVKSISKPDYKEKVRLRSYNVPESETLVFLEIKKKYKKIVNKRRVTITYNQAIDYIFKGINPLPNSQIMKEIDYTFKRYNLLPKVAITYDRLSFFSKEDTDLRITFDKDIKYSVDIKKLDALENEKKLLEDKYVMEIKSLNGLPFWLVNALNELKLYPTSFSKYGKVYTRLRKENVYV